MKVTLTIKATIGYKRCIPLLTALFLHAQADCFGQKNTINHLSVTGRYSLPVGRLAKEKADDPLAGLAGAGAGLSLRLPISGPLYIHFPGDFMATKAALNDVVVNVRIGTYPEINQLVDERRFVVVVNVGMGLGFAF